jgi:hypothetical protein
MQCTRK